jgi:type I restriction enzyme S subunit
LPVVLPDAATLAAFDAQAEPLYIRIAQNERETRTLAQTRDLLLPRLMSGELRVADAEQTLAEAL